MTDMEKAKQLLTAPGMTCVLCRGDVIYKSTKSGISPMLDYLEHGTDLSHFSVADKIVGKAAAMLFILAGIDEVYGEVVSDAGLAVLRAHGIRCSCGQTVNNIINRKGDGSCPMEQAVLNIHEPKEAEKALREKLRQLKASAAK